MVHEIAASLTVGLLSGIASGLLGVSPGGGLVVFSALLLGVGQHVAQGVSLIAQVAPMGLAGVRRYRAKVGRAPTRWLVLLAIGFLFGGVVGALGAASVSGTVLRWAYVAYLVALDALMLLRAVRHAPSDAHGRKDARISSSALLAVGLAGGVSSGFLGIGGGLAITIGLGAVLKAPQHQAQLVSLVLSAVPTTLPATFVYWRAGWTTPWPIVAAVVLGLCGGTDVGARLANRIDQTTLRRLAIGFVSAMAIAMALKAVG